MLYTMLYHIDTNCTRTYYCTLHYAVLHYTALHYTMLYAYVYFHRIYRYWGSEAYFGQLVAPFRLVMQIESISAPIWGYRLDWYGQDIAIMMAIAIGYRIIAFILCKYTNRHKQK
jgi:hypothetical protein